MRTLAALLLALVPAELLALDCKDPQNILKCPQEFTEAFLPQPWHEQGPAFLAAKEAIMDLKQKGKDEEDKEKDIRLAIQAKLDEPARTDDLKDAKIAAVLALKRNLKETTEKKYAFYNQVVSLTVDTYHLRPILTEAPNVFAGPGAIKAQSWQPHYSEKEVSDGNGFMRRQTDQEALARGAKDGQPPGQPLHVGGRTTFQEARIRVFIHSFDSPGELAANIYHETVHWLDIAGRGWALGPHETFRTEEKAYDRTSGLGAVFELSQDKIDFYKAQSKEYGAKALQTPGTSTWGQVGAAHPNWVESLALDESGRAPAEPGEPGRPESERVRSDEEFRRAISDIQGISRESKAIVVRHMEEKKRRDEDERRREKSVHDAAWSYLKTAAGLACSDPQALAGEIAAGRVVGVGLPSVRIQIFLILDADALNSCQKSIIETLLAASGPMPAEQLVAWAEQYRRDNPGFFQRLLTGLGDFVGALGEFLKSQPSSSGGGGGGSRERSEPPERGDGSRGSRGGPNDNGPAINQLRGIKARGW